MKRYLLLLAISLLISCRHTPQETAVLTVGPQPDGSILVPTNQLLRPAGFQVIFPGRPVDLALSPDGRLLAVLNSSSLDILRVLDRAIVQSLHFRGGGSFRGVLFSHDGKKIYVSQARDRVLVAAADHDNIFHWEDPVLFPPAPVGGYPVPGGMQLSDDGRTLYVVLNRSNMLAVVDLENKKTIRQIPVGVAPYGVLLATPEKAYVTNWGGRHPGEEEDAYPSSGTEVVVDENGVAASGSVSVVDLKEGKEVKEIETGLHPGAMLLSAGSQELFVACASSDYVAVIDIRTDKVKNTLSVHIDKDLPFGSAPNALVCSADGKTLFVANGTDNAVCVIDLEEDGEVEGMIPTAWYPGALVLDKSHHALIVANVKGVGERNRRADQRGYNTHNPLGSISFITLPGAEELQAMTATVRSNNDLADVMKHLTGKKKHRASVPVPQFPGEKSLFEHVIYIIKENRTYDQLFGDMPQGEGDTALVHFGREVTPNHHALAEQFVLLDNFYCSGVLSADGHQWTDEAYVTDYLEKFFGDFPRSYPYDGGDPLAYAPTGFLWDNVLRHNLTFRNYGEFVDAQIDPPHATFKEIWQDYRAGTGRVKIRAEVNLPQLKPYTCPDYIGFPNRVSDQYRADVFIRELKEFEENDSFPNLVILLLPNDHTSGTRPGMPTPKAAVADNDLALGRIVEAVSHSKFWKNTVILVTEDDPQAGLDHVDSHRTVGLVISPYTKRGEVISTYYSQVSMFRTIENILGIPPLNRFDVAALPMTDCFTATPDFTPYRALPANIPLDRINPSLKDLSGQALYWAEKSLEQDLEDLDRIDEDTFNRILWYAVKGYDRPYPGKGDKDEG